jgi:4-diphosphocytidyl-2C-methyl-D-erythritol kinase
MKINLFYVGDEPKDDGHHLVTLVTAVSHHEHVQLLAAMKNHEVVVEVKDGTTTE